MWELAKQWARVVKKKPTMVESLARWWSKKYSIPSSHELFQESLMIDLMVEFWLDRFDNSPLEVHRNADGFIQLKDTGDPLIDKWEEKIAQGEEPDLWEAFSPEAIEDLARLRRKAAGLQGQGEFTMANTMRRVNRDAQLQGLPNVEGTLQPPARSRGGFNTFGDGTD